ncbi:lysozyme inhibitor LprI family protein [Phenylobacterium sp.]|uniref:lysozyme inhibitor LprI family protein n=1 Tax=Phenylobacterium sp. TaxID=1871053 RepID=UPI002732B8C9|nr:lysozyme inhibitor LprI family protein [Phenylobacterium sp.]MDP3632560.1 lysozyme inhibitor LprI family protein [Phenylobacterium sp.]MDZ4055228.1 lysozyme inhibitor LprI family protein [Phenylobacterium sp.]
MTTETRGGSPPDAPIVVGPPAKSPFSRPMILAGVAGACVLGLGLGLLARPQLAEDTRTPGSMKPVEQVQIEIDRDEPLPAVSGGKLELLPSGLQAPRPAPATPPAALPAALPVSEIQPPVRQTRPVARGPSFDCAQSASAAEELVCNDETLAAQDRRLASAWRRAMDSGVPMHRLRRQQQRWLDAREDAARHAPEEVADLYDQRIQELDEVAAYER